MYEGYYGFTEKPFNLTPDPKYLYLSQRHSEAFAHLEFGRRERGGFAVITGEVGTGKTTLARYFLGRLGDKTATAVVLYPALTAAELLRSILDDLHVPAGGGSLKELVDALHRFLLTARAEGRDVVLLIDEAQDLSPMQWRMVGRRGRYASWTIVGDQAQSSWPHPQEAATARAAALEGRSEERRVGKECRL